MINLKEEVTVLVLLYTFFIIIFIIKMIALFIKTQIFFNL